jgi:hypothetical protein
VALTDQEQIEVQRRIIDKHIRVENAYQWDAVYDTMRRDEHAFYDAVPLSTHFPRFTGVQHFYGMFEKSIPDFYIHVTASYDTPGTSVLEYTITGTHLGEYCGVAPQGNSISIEMACLFIFRKGDPFKIIAEQLYFDNETLLRQMRGERKMHRSVPVCWQRQ